MKICNKQKKLDNLFLILILGKAYILQYFYCSLFGNMFKFTNVLTNSTSVHAELFCPL
jgi:hypothetical protein